MTITVEKLGEDRLSRQVWVFSGTGYWHESPKLMLHSYANEMRDTTRHKWKPAGNYSRYSRLDNRNYWDGYGLKIEDVPRLPDPEVIDALAKATVVVYE